jgi:hypothetical protein
MHLYANEGGEIFPCCVSTETNRAVCDEKGESYKVYRAGDVESAWNSKYMTTLRQDMLTGRRHEICRKCYETEDSGVHSYRQGMNAAHAHIKPLTGPAYFSIQALPEKLKAKAAKILSDYKIDAPRKSQAEAERFQGEINALVRFMMAQDRSDQYPEFVRVTEIYDRSRKQSLRELVPELASVRVNALSAPQS